MEKDVQIHTLLEKMERNSRRQLFYTRLMCVFCLVAAICCIGMITKLNAFLPQLQLFAAQAETILSNLESVTQELAKADLNGMVSNINDLVTTSQTGLEEAMGKFNEMDFEVLNKTIRDLSVVVERLARIASIFG